MDDILTTKTHKTLLAIKPQPSFLSSIDNYVTLNYLMRMYKRQSKEMTIYDGMALADLSDLDVIDYYGEKITDFDAINPSGIKYGMKTGYIIALNFKGCWIGWNCEKWIKELKL